MKRAIRIVPSFIFVITIPLVGHAVEMFIYNSLLVAIRFINQDGIEL